MGIVWKIVIGIVSVIILLSIIGIFRKKNYKWTQSDTIKSIVNTLRASYIWRVLVAFDTFLNVLTFGLPGETISARCGRWGIKRRGNTLDIWIAKFMLSWLDVIQPDHGFQAMSGDLARAQRIVQVETDALDSLK